MFQNNLQVPLFALRFSHCGTILMSGLTLRLLHRLCCCCRYLHCHSQRDCHFSRLAFVPSDKVLDPKQLSSFKSSFKLRPCVHMRLPYVASCLCYLPERTSDTDL